MPRRRVEGTQPTGPARLIHRSRSASWPATAREGGPPTTTRAANDQLLLGGSDLRMIIGYLSETWAGTAAAWRAMPSSATTGRARAPHAQGGRPWMIPSATIPGPSPHTPACRRGRRHPAAAHHPRRAGEAIRHRARPSRYPADADVMADGQRSREVAVDRGHVAGVGWIENCPSVGAAGFEPATPCSQSRCATGLRHAPKNLEPNCARNCAPNACVPRRLGGGRRTRSAPPRTRKTTRGPLPVPERWATARSGSTSGGAGMGRKRTGHRIIGRNGRACGDFRSYVDVGGGREALAPPGTTWGTTDAEIAEELFQAR